MPFYVETGHGKPESTVVFYPENFPPGDILSATRKTAQASEGAVWRRMAWMALWVSEGRRVRFPLPKEWRLQQTTEQEVSNAATATTMSHPDRCCPRA